MLRKIHKERNNKPNNQEYTHAYNDKKYWQNAKYEKLSTYSIIRTTFAATEALDT
jgi:hypothetical protein